MYFSLPLAWIVRLKKKCLLSSELGSAERREYEQTDLFLPGSPLPFLSGTRSYPFLRADSKSSASRAETAPTPGHPFEMRVPAPEGRTELRHSGFPFSIRQGQKLLLAISASRRTPDEEAGKRMNVFCLAQEMA